MGSFIQLISSYDEHGMLGGGVKSWAAKEQTESEDSGAE